MGKYYFDYKESQKIAAEDHSFYALIIAAMRQADTRNMNELKAIFPEVYDEFVARYNATAGVLDSDAESVKQYAWGDWRPERES